MIPVYDSQAATLTLPLPLAGAITAVMVLILAVAVFRANGGATLMRIAVVAILAVAAWRVIEGIGEYSDNTRRAALEARAIEVGAMAGRMPTLACLDGFAGETVTAACERAVFATPQSVAAGLSYTAARLAVVMEGAAASAAASEAEGAAKEGRGLARLRRGLEQDTFGFLAHLLETRDQCTREECAAFAALRDASRVQANLAERAFEDLVKRHGANWPEPGARPVAQTDPPEPGAAATTAASSRVNFPSAASIPPISIMTAEPPPAAPPSASGAPTAEAQPRPRPAQRSAPAPRLRGSERSSGPLPLQSAPPAAPEPPRPQ